MPWCSFIHIICAWGLWSFLDLLFYSFYQVWKHFSHYVFKYIFLLPPFLTFPFRTPVTWMLCTWLPEIVPQLRNALFFLLLFFSLSLSSFILDSFFCYVYSLIHILQCVISINLIGCNFHLSHVVFMSRIFIFYSFHVSTKYIQSI